MKTTKTFIMLACVCLVGVRSAAAQDHGSSTFATPDHGSVTFATGLSVSNGSALTSTLAALVPSVADRVNFGGRVAFNIAPGFQAFGEVGRLGNVLPPFTTDILAFTRLDLRASAFYTEGGVRTFLGGHSAVNPYVEATGGVSHLSVRLAGLNSTAQAIEQLGLNFTNR